MYAHTGIVSSATAILKDLEDKGILSNVLAVSLGWGGRTGGEGRCWLGSC
jgi:hypothetical protein